MKIKINRNVKLVSVILFLITIILMSIQIFSKIKNPSIIETRKEVYSYNQSGSINYKANLKPNPLYTTNSLSGSPYLIANFIKDIDFMFQYDFNGHINSNIKGEYSVIGVVEGVNAEGEKQTPIWKKEFILLPKTSFESKEKLYTLQKIVSVNLGQYNDFANKVFEQSGINTKAQLKLLWNVKINGGTKLGPFNDVVNQSVVIPLNTQYYRISGQFKQEKPGKIMITNSIKDPTQKEKIALFSIVDILALILFLCLIKFTKSNNDIDPRKKELKMILSKYSNRLVALDEDIIINNGHVIAVQTFEDLVRIGDELGQPIMYIKIQRFLYQFFISYNNKTFLYKINIFEEVSNSNLNNLAKTV